MRVLRRTALLGSYHHSDRTLVAELPCMGRSIRFPTGCISAATIPSGPSGRS